MQLDIWCPDLAPPGWSLISADDEPPFPDLFCPSGLLSRFTLEVRGPVTACGRDAIAVTATRRTSMGRWPRLLDSFFDRLEVIVDAEFGIVLPSDVIVDAELGCLLRLTSYAGDRPASWWELRDIGSEPGEPGEFRLPVPSGVRTVEETGNPLADAAAVMPGTTGYAVHTAAGAVRRTAGAVSATRSFLDDLRGRRPR